MVKKYKDKKAFSEELENIQVNSSDILSEIFQDPKFKEQISAFIEKFKSLEIYYINHKEEFSQSEMSDIEFILNGGPFAMGKVKSLANYLEFINLKKK